MRPRDLFDRIRPLWPDAVVLTDRSAGDADEPLWSLIHTYEQIERTVEDDDWLALGAWAFHQALTELADLERLAGDRVVLPSSVSLTTFDRYVRANLQDDSWAIERQKYGPMSD